MERRQCLASHGIGSSVEEHFDLRVIALSGVIRHPAARLEMKILQTWSFAARFSSQYFVVCPALATSMYLREILKEESRATNEGEQRSVMIGGEGVKTGFNIGEILQKQFSHIGVKSAAVRHWRVGRDAPPCFWTITSPRCFRKAPQCETVPDIPSDARQLANAIGHSGYCIRVWCTHGLSFRTQFPPVGAYVYATRHAV
jgi:hypothetical protein